jgi:hypothetical protein
VTQGKVYDYLGMRIDYSPPGKVKITMFDYIDRMLDELPVLMDGEAATPASNHLFVVNENNPQKLERKESEVFHHNMVKLLFVQTSLTRLANSSGIFNYSCERPRPG